MAVSVAQIIANAKVNADKVNDASIDDTTGWLVFVNRSVEALWRLLTGLDFDLYFAESADFTLTATPTGATKDLSTLTPTGYRALHGLDISAGTGNRKTVPRRNFRERNRGVVGWWTPGIMATDRAYDIRGRTLVVTPYEAAGGTYRAYFRAGPYLFTGTADVTPLDWQLEPYVEYIELRAARRALGIEESDTGPLASDLAEVIAEITAAHTRDDGSPAVIADVEGETAGGP